MSDCLPHDVFLEILLRLPTKSLVRFRCVSRSCNSIITNPNFITTHLHRPYKHDLFVVVKRCTGRPKELHCSAHFDNGNLDRFLELNSPFQVVSDNFEVIGSCNGLVCVVDDIGGHYKSIVILWNPSIRKSVTLSAPQPLVRSRYCSQSDVTFGFGFDSRTNDYKVVRILNLSGYGRRKAPIKVQLYSLDTNSWKSVNAIVPYCRTIYGERAFSNENFHWLSRYLRDDNVFKIFILSFDMRDEVFREIMIPESSGEAELSLSILGKSLCLLQEKGDDKYTTYDVWVMREHGVAESWTKQFSFIDEDYRISRVLGFRNNGDLLYGDFDSNSDSEELVLQTLKTKEIKFLEIRGDLSLEPFVESLVLINQENDVDCGKVA